VALYGCIGTRHAVESIARFTGNNQVGGHGRRIGESGVVCMLLRHRAQRTLCELPFKEGFATRGGRSANQDEACAETARLFRASTRQGFDSCVQISSPSTLSGFTALSAGLCQVADAYDWLGLRDAIRNWNPIVQPQIFWRGPPQPCISMKKKLTSIFARAPHRCHPKSNCLSLGASS
jgi:hypothetical protein